MRDKLKKIFCVLFGHSRIIDNCIGYIHCARCGEMVGDTLAGVFDVTGYTIVGHNCDKCKDAYRKMNWKDKLFTPNPFKSKQ